MSVLKKICAYKNCFKETFCRDKNNWQYSQTKTSCAEIMCKKIGNIINLQIGFHIKEAVNGNLIYNNKRCIARKYESNIPFINCNISNGSESN